METIEAPLFPAGEYSAPANLDEPVKEGLIRQLAKVPSQVRQAITSLSDAQLDTRYRNWTVRQIVHHLADSHINCYVRFKWALTEPTPTIKSYDETSWSELPDARQIPLEASLRILEGVHARWSAMIELLTQDQLDLQFFHPESQSNVRLIDALPHYVWHARHHLAQIEWLREKNRW